MDECQPKCMAVKLLIIGLILILVRLYTAWDIWVVLGAILIVKAVVLFFMPKCSCNIKTKKKK
jgi:hypothetical protein